MDTVKNPPKTISLSEMLAADGYYVARLNEIEVPLLVVRGQAYPQVHERLPLPSDGWSEGVQFIRLIPEQS